MVTKKNSIFWLCIFLFQNIFCVDQNFLAKAFWHVGALQDNLVFYLKFDPKLKLVSKNNSNNYIQEIYEIEKTKIQSTDAQYMIEKINKRKHPFYEVNVSEVSNNIQIKLQYDTKFVKKVIPLFFDSISQFKGINFVVEHSSVKGILKAQKCEITNKNMPIVILDFGHGGKDPGAKGVNGCLEKDITFNIGIKLKKKLESQNLNVFLTRNNDDFIDLDKRTSMANLLFQPSIFISIHANSSLNPDTHGLETYYYDSSLFRNFEKNKKIFKKSNDEKNKSFAALIHDNLFKTCKKVNKNFIDRKIRKSISQILLGTDMPTALIESGFLSNKKECEMLCNDKYQDTIADGILAGIKKYFDLKGIK